jgi:argininosuccinate lyase
MPFRQAHGVAGQAVRIAAEQGVPLSRLSLDVLRELSDLFEQDVDQVFDFEISVSRRRATGGTAPEAIKQQIAQAEAWMQGQQGD